MSSKNKKKNTHLLPCIHVRTILLSVYLLFAWRCYAFFSHSSSIQRLSHRRCPHSVATILTHSLVIDKCVQLCAYGLLTVYNPINDLVSTVLYSSFHSHPTLVLFHIIALRSEIAIPYWIDECMCRNLAIIYTKCFIFFLFIHFLRFHSFFKLSDCNSKRYCNCSFILI